MLLSSPVDFGASLPVMREAVISLIQLRFPNKKALQNNYVMYVTKQSQLTMSHDLITYAYSFKAKY